MVAYSTFQHTWSGLGPARLGFSESEGRRDVEIMDKSSMISQQEGSGSDPHHKLTIVIIQTSWPSSSWFARRARPRHHSG